MEVAFKHTNRMQSRVSLTYHYVTYPFGDVCCCKLCYKIILLTDDVRHNGCDAGCGWFLLVIGNRRVSINLDWEVEWYHQSCDLVGYAVAFIFQRTSFVGVFLLV